MNPPIPEPGQIVIVRQRPFVVNDVKASALPPPARVTGVGSPQHLLQLSSIEDEGLGEELSVIWELEPGVESREKAQLPKLKAFDAPRTFDAFLDAVAWGAVSSADDKALQAPFRSGVDVDDYQLDPVVRALSMPRVNLLIADDVGLGKTIESGLVLQELILRHRVRSVLIICPSSIQVQWKEEMHDKFGLEFRIVDSELMADLRRRRGIRVNPWAHFPRLITSIDFIKRERPMRLFKDTLPFGGTQPAFPRPYDLLIVDEAHNVAPSGRGKYATDSQRTMAIRSLVPSFEHKLFLSATPHNGYPESFSALLELLDNQRFARAAKPNRTQLDAVMIRRMKSELELRWDGTRRFAKRFIDPLEVTYSAAERKAHVALRRYSELRVASAAGEGQRFATDFVLKLLKKRLFSSPAAFAVTIEKHARSVTAAERGGEGRAWLREIDEAENELANDEEYELTALEAVDTASRHVAALSAEEKALLGDLRSFASAAANTADSKARRLIQWLKQELKPGGHWSDRRVIFFTEYRATQKWLHDLLAAEGLGGERMLMIYGGMPLEDRERIKAAFQAAPAESPVRILLATDAASEGINLQNHCWQLVHYEIPWNPNRMEQRNGRVDRHGQKNPEVHVYHFVGAGFEPTKPGQVPGDLEGDLEFLLRAVLKVETIREDLGKVGPVIADQVEQAMLGRRKTLDTQKAERDSEPVRAMLKFERKLRDQLEKLAKQLDETKRSLHLSPANIQNVIETGLALAGQPPLKPSAEVGAFLLPTFTGSWSYCAEGLAHPHTKMIRPIVFDHARAAGRDDVVLCHLNHRLVQMCLRLLRAEVWSQSEAKKLNRFTARGASDDAIRTPVAVVHGRLLVLGRDGHRIHEEVIVAGGELREGRFSRMNVGEVTTALEGAVDDGVPEAIADRLVSLWPAIETAALQALESRMRERTKNLDQFLADRSDREVANFMTVMRELERSITEALAEKDAPQQRFDWSEIEKQQRERDLGSLRSRLNELPAELAREVEHLRSRYQEPKPRLFPIAVTFLVPPRAIAALRQGGGL